MTCAVSISEGGVWICVMFFFLMIRRPPRSTLDRSSAASDVYKRQWVRRAETDQGIRCGMSTSDRERLKELERENRELKLSLIHISEPTRPY